jgi:Fe-S cluster biosynthesis and repair protein YggX
MPRIVHCVKLDQDLPGLDTPPFPGELGQRIYDNVSQQAWQMWNDQAKLIINHYGLNMGDPEARATLRREMEEFFFGENAAMPEGWTPPSTTSTKGGGAPQTKGGAAPSHK